MGGGIMGKVTGQYGRRTICVVAVIVVGVIGLLLLVAGSLLSLVGPSFGVQRKRVQVLCRTDHAALRQACQAFSRQVAAGELAPGSYRMRAEPGKPTLTLPEVIRELRPTVIDIQASGRVVVVLSGGLGGIGVIAYPEQYEEPHVNFHYGDRELIPNLWYLDRQYVGNADYDKFIDGIVRRYGTRGD
jgi:hypothetical protein